MPLSCMPCKNDSYDKCLFLCRQSGYNADSARFETNEVSEYKTLV